MPGIEMLHISKAISKTWLQDNFDKQDDFRGHWSLLVDYKKAYKRRNKNN